MFGVFHDPDTANLCTNRKAGTVRLTPTDHLVFKNPSILSRTMRGHLTQGGAAPHRTRGSPPLRVEAVDG